MLLVRVTSQHDRACSCDGSKACTCTVWCTTSCCGIVVHPYVWVHECRSVTNGCGVGEFVLHQPVCVFVCWRIGGTCVLECATLPMCWCPPAVVCAVCCHNYVRASHKRLCHAAKQRHWHSCSIAKLCHGWVATIKHIVMYQVWWHVRD